MEFWKKCINPRQKEKIMEEGCASSLERKQCRWDQEEGFKEQGLSGENAGAGEEC